MVQVHIIYYGSFLGDCSRVSWNPLVMAAFTYPGRFDGHWLSYHGLALMLIWNDGKQLQDVLGNLILLHWLCPCLPSYCMRSLDRLQMCQQQSSKLIGVPGHVVLEAQYFTLDKQGWEMRHISEHTHIYICITHCMALTIDTHCVRTIQKVPRSSKLSKLVHKHIKLVHKHIFSQTHLTNLVLCSINLALELLLSINSANIQ